MPTVEAPTEVPPAHQQHGRKRSQQQDEREASRPEGGIKGSDPKSSHHHRQEPPSKGSCVMNWKMFFMFLVFLLLLVSFIVAAFGCMSSALMSRDLHLVKIQERLTDAGKATEVRIGYLAICVASGENSFCTLSPPGFTSPAQMAAKLLPKLVAHGIPDSKPVLEALAFALALRQQLYFPIFAISGGLTFVCTLVLSLGWLVSHNANPLAKHRATKVAMIFLYPLQAAVALGLVSAVLVTVANLALSFMTEQFAQTRFVISSGSAVMFFHWMFLVVLFAFKTALSYRLNIANARGGRQQSRGKQSGEKSSRGRRQETV